MNLPWGSDIANRFITNVGLITTRGSHGDNIMACEWTHHLSYDPALVGVSLHPRHATHDQIRETKAFGICIASVGQTVLASLAGKESGKQYDKIKIAEALGFTFSPAKTIQALLVNDSSVQLECKLYREFPLGDHTLFVGEVLEGNFHPDKNSLAYHQGKYWGMSSTLDKPAPELREKIKILFEKHRK